MNLNIKGQQKAHIRYSSCMVSIMLAQVIHCHHISIDRTLAIHWLLLWSSATNKEKPLMHNHVILFIFGVSISSVKLGSHVFLTSYFIFSKLVQQIISASKLVQQIISIRIRQFPQKKLFNKPSSCSLLISPMHTKKHIKIESVTHAPC